MSRNRTSVTAVGLVVVLAGCGSSPDTGPGERAAALFAARAPYLGDNSRVSALVDEVGPAPAGRYTLALQTTTPSLELRVDLRRPDKPFATTDFRQPATLLLGLIGNVDQVTFSYGSDSFTLTAAAASSTAGFDVKRLGQDRQVLTDYLRTTSD